MDFYNKHYITVDERGCITNGFSDAFHQATDKDICINEQGGYQFRLFPDGEENPVLFEREYHIPLYRFENGSVRKRSAEEIAADVSALPEPEPSDDEKRDAQIFYTAMMTDTLLEV